MRKILYRIWPLLLAACASHPSIEIKSPPESVGFELVAMGTVWSFKIPQSAFDESRWWTLKNRSQEILEHYDQVFSNWRKDSEVSQLDRKMKKGSTLNDYRAAHASDLFLEGFAFAEQAKQMTHGAFDVQSPKGLDFGGLTKGHVLAELAWTFLNAGLGDFSIDGGGGNQVFSGVFRPGTYADKGTLVFRSASAGLQHGKQHIFDRRNPRRKIDSTVVIYCWAVLNKINREAPALADLQQTKLVGSLSDALTKGLLIDRQNWALPNFCQELKTSTLKFF